MNTPSQTPAVPRTRRRAARSRIVVAIATAAVSGVTVLLPVGPALGVEDTPETSFWTTSKCGVDEATPEIPAGSFVKVVVTGAPGTWAWGINGGKGHAGGNGSVLMFRSTAPTDEPRTFLARAGCTTAGNNWGDVAGAAGWSPGGAGQKGGGAGGGSSALCEDTLSCESKWFENVIAVAGGGGGGGGGTCSSQWGWDGGAAGTGYLTQWAPYPTFSFLNGSDGAASPNTGARVPTVGQQVWTGTDAGARYNGGQLGGAAGGGGGFYTGGGAGTTHGGGCQTGGGGGGGASALTANAFQGPSILNWRLTDTSTSSAGGSVKIWWQANPF